MIKLTLEEKILYIVSLGYEGKEVLIRYSLLRTEEIILNYINLNKLPKGSDFTHIEMAISHLEQQLTTSSNITGNQDNSSNSKVSSIQEGDTTVKMATASDSETSSDKAKSKRIFEDKLLNDFRVSLHKFRKMRW